MSTTAMSFTLPEWMVKRLNTQKNKSQVVQEALSMYFAKQEVKKYRNQDLYEFFKYSNAIARKYNPIPLTVEEIIELKNRGRK